MNTFLLIAAITLSTLGAVLEVIAAVRLSKPKTRTHIEISPSQAAAALAKAGASKRRRSWAEKRDATTALLRAYVERRDGKVAA